jgi:hypothetical protein
MPDLTQTTFLKNLAAPSEGSFKTKIVWELIATKKHPEDRVRLLGCAREDTKTYYYFQVPAAVVEIEIAWNKDKGEYERHFSNVFDQADELMEMLGYIPE